MEILLIPWVLTEAKFWRIAAPLNEESAGVALKPAFSPHCGQEAVSCMPGDHRDGKELAIFRVPNLPLRFLIGLFTFSNPFERRWFSSRFLSKFPQGHVWGSGKWKYTLLLPFTAPSQFELEKLCTVLAGVEHSCHHRLG